MAARTILAVLPGAGPHQRLQVALSQDRGGKLTIDLRDQHYAEGIGWFDQRSLALEPAQFRQLQAVLGLKGVPLDEPDEPPATLPFPGPTDTGPRRHASGEGI